MIAPGTTPSANVTVQDQAGVGGLKLNRLDTGTFDTSEFEIAGGGAGTFQMKVLNADKIQTGTLKVGGGGSKPGQLGVFDGNNQLVAWAGQQGIYYGIWGKQLWVGGADPSNAPLYVDSGGNVKLETVGAYSPSFKLVKNSVTTELLHDINHAEGGYGVRVYSSTYEHRMSPYFMGMYYGSSPRIKIDASTRKIEVLDTSGTTAVLISDTNGVVTYGSRDISAAGDLKTSGVFKMGAYTIFDSSRNMNNVGNAIITGYLDSGSYIDALSGFRVNGTTVIDSSRNITGASLDVSGNCEANAFRVNTNEVIDSSRNADFVTLKIGGQTMFDSSQNLTLTSGEYLKVHVIRCTNYVTSGSPASAATHKIPVYDGSGTLLNYMYLYP
jgi:hypothetical protein